ncbi:M67 family metallopeptidase, partial [Candidatus Aerophobetes bacterium]|nr:M67 family metallopeptidase [Candidatus Aerophobetes bacterium]
MLTLKKSHLDSIIEHCKKEHPFEACGLLVGNNTEVEEVFAMSNVKKSKTEYLVEPKEQFKVFEKMRMEKKELLLGIYHSHPVTGAYPSSRDKSMAFYPQASYVIVSLQNFSRPEVSSFKIKEGKILKEKINIV